MPYPVEMFPRLIALDLDGTLLNSDGEVSPRNRNALALAERAGAEIVIATGRRHCYALRVLSGLGLPDSNALVSSNGTVIRTLGSELLHRSHLSLESTRWLIQHLDAFRNTMVITFDTVGPHGEDAKGALVVEHLDELHTSIDRWMTTNAPYIRHVDRFEDALQGDPPIQIMLCGSVDRMAAAEARLLESPRVSAVGAAEHPGTEIALHRTSYPDRDLSIVDILPAGSSKATALAHLAQLRGLLPSDVLAVGDNWNDVPMLRFAGRAALMANAPAELHALARQSGWAVTSANDEDGVADAIEQSLAPSLAQPLVVSA